MKSFKKAPRAQRGAVLVVGVILMLAATMATLAGVRGNRFHERMAANQDLQALALMTAEGGATRFADWLMAEADENGWPTEANGRRDSWQDADIATCPEDLRSESGIESCVSIDEDALEWSGSKVSVNVVGRAISAAGVLSEAVIRFEAEGTSLDLPPPAAQAAYTCFGANCNFQFRGAPVKISGKDHPVSGGDFECNGGGCNYGPDDWADETAGIAMPNRPSGGASDDARQVEGSPKVQRGGGGGATDNAGDWSAYVAALMNSVTPHSIGPGSGLPASGRDNPALMQINGNVTLNGNGDTAGVIVVGSGSSLSLKGTFHHEGLIIIMPGGSLSFSAGTAWIYGGVIDMSGNSNAHLVDLRGTINVRYSSEAINNLSKLAPAGAVAIRGWQSQS